MPKTSIAKKKLNSKNKRLYKGREKVRGIKIQKQKLVQEKMFVDKLKKLKDKGEKLIEMKKIEKEMKQESENEVIE